MKTNFERVKEMLASMHAKSSKVTGPEVRQALDALSATYLSLGNAAAQPVDYTQPATQMAYVYRHIAAHAHLMYLALHAGGSRVSTIFNRKRTRAMCIGGGPGTEIVGFLKYAERLNVKGQRQIDCTIFDHAPTWNSALSAAKSTAPTNILVSSTTVTASLTDANYWVLPAVLPYDIVTFSYCLSEVWRYDSSGYVTAQVKDIIDRSPTGTIFIYLDNDGPTFNANAEGVFKRNDLEILDKTCHNHMLIGNDEESSTVAEFKAWAGNRFPKLKGEAMRMTLVKL